MRRGVVWGLIGSILINIALVAAVVRLGSQVDDERAQRVDLEIQLDELLAEQEQAGETPAAGTAASATPATPTASGVVAAAPAAASETATAKPATP